jgi:hypothetical protein
MKQLGWFILFISIFFPKLGNAQLSFELKTSPNIVFDFNTIQKYETGITVMNAIELKVLAIGNDWDLYVGATTALNGFWDVNSTYSNVGVAPTTNLIQVRFRNISNTPSNLNFFPLQDISTPTNIIGNLGVLDGPTVCPASETNTPGSYLVNPECYLFHVDLKIVPGFSFKPGLYTLRIDYMIVRDL